MRAVIFDLDHTLFAASGALHADVAELLAILRRLGVRIAGLTNGDHRMLVRLEDAGIRSYFNEVLCADGPAEPKAAAGVQHVLARLGAQPHHAILISHAHADILLGKEAGLGKTIGITHGKDSAGPLEEAGADHLVSDIPSVLDVLD